MSEGLSEGRCIVKSVCRRDVMTVSSAYSSSIQIPIIALGSPQEEHLLGSSSW